MTFQSVCLRLKAFKLMQQAKPLSKMIMFYGESHLKINKTTKKPLSFSTKSKKVISPTSRCKTFCKRCSYRSLNAPKFGSFPIHKVWKFSPNLCSLLQSISGIKLWKTLPSNFQNRFHNRCLQVLVCQTTTEQLFHLSNRKTKHRLRLKHRRLDNKKWEAHHKWFNRIINLKAI